MFQHYLENNPLPIGPFWKKEPTEASVQLVFREYCKPGDIVFDIGANKGALSKLMSRFVGPKGIVCAFEASPRVIELLHYNLVLAGCHNVTVYNRAVYHETGAKVGLYEVSHLNESLYNTYSPLDKRDATLDDQVLTVTLDDFVDQSGLVPSFIKIDIEGAELDALRGAHKLLSQHKPTLVLEQGPTVMHCYEHLRGLGYIAIDLADYRRLPTAADFAAGQPIMDILYVHESKAKDDPYWNIGEPDLVADIEASDLVNTSGADFSMKTPLILGPGRYVCLADFSATNDQNHYYVGVKGREGEYVRYSAGLKLLADCYAKWVFHLFDEDTITPYIQCINQPDPTLQINGFKVFAFNGMDKVQRSVFE